MISGVYTESGLPHATLLKFYNYCKLLIDYIIKRLKILPRNKCGNKRLIIMV